jgi:hypothetical protein
MLVLVYRPVSAVLESVSPIRIPQLSFGSSGTIAIVGVSVAVSEGKDVAVILGKGTAEG